MKTPFTDFVIDMLTKPGSVKATVFTEQSLKMFVDDMTKLIEMGIAEVERRDEARSVDNHRN